MFQSADDPLDVLYGQEAIQIIGESEHGLETRMVRRSGPGPKRPSRGGAPREIKASTSAASSLRIAVSCRP